MLNFINKHPATRNRYQFFLIIFFSLLLTYISFLDYYSWNRINECFSDYFDLPQCFRLINETYSIILLKIFSLFFNQADQLNSLENKTFFLNVREFIIFFILFFIVQKIIIKNNNKIFYILPISIIVYSSMFYYGNNYFFYSPTIFINDYLVLIFLLFPFAYNILQKKSFFIFVFLSFFIQEYLPFIFLSIYFINKIFIKKEKYFFEIASLLSIIILIIFLLVFFNKLDFFYKEFFLKNYQLYGIHNHLGTFLRELDKILNLIFLSLFLSIIGLKKNSFKLSISVFYFLILLISLLYFFEIINFKYKILYIFLYIFILTKILFSLKLFDKTILNIFLINILYIIVIFLGYFLAGYQSEFGRQMFPFSITIVFLSLKFLQNYSLSENH